MARGGVSAAVYEVTEGPHAGGFVIAEWSDRSANYTASMTAASARLTGCSGVFARTIRGIAESANVQVYATAASARRALRRAVEVEW